MRQLKTELVSFQQLSVIEPDYLTPSQAGVNRSDFAISIYRAKNDCLSRI